MKCLRGQHQFKLSHREGNGGDVIVDENTPFWADDDNSRCPAHRRYSSLSPHNNRVHAAHANYGSQWSDRIVISANRLSPPPFFSLPLLPRTVPPLFSCFSPLAHAPGIVGLPILPSLVMISRSESCILLEEEHYRNQRRERGKGKSAFPACWSHFVTLPHQPRSAFPPFVPLVG